MRLPALFAAALAAMIPLTAPPLAAREPLRVAFPEYRPYFWRDEGGAMHGFFHDIISEALETRMGVPLAWSPYPWQRCQALVREGRQDALVTVPTPERSAYTVTHDEPFYLKPLHLFTYAGHPRMEELRAIRGIPDIKKGGFTVVTNSGNGWNRLLVESADIPCLRTPTLKNVWLMLGGRRGDLAIEWPESAWPGIREAGVQDSVEQVSTGAVISYQPFHLLIRKGCAPAGLLDRFDEVIRAMREDGSIDRIMSRYGLPR
ncbi:substrate-binding periplasmic protein [Desulfocurvus sp. DL9XJH121]